MKTDPRKYTLQFLLIALVVFAVLTLLAPFLSEAVVTGLFFAAATALLITFTAVMVRYLKNEIVSETKRLVVEKTDNLFAQAEALSSIRPFVPAKLPLPGTRGWAASPDLLRVIYREILTHRPQTIVELGSGISSLYNGYLLRQVNGQGKIFAIDHSKDYFHITRSNVEEHGLSDVVEVVHCEMTGHRLNGREWQWYDINKAPLPLIDLLVVDGPVNKMDKEVRYPALPLLYDKLAGGAAVIVDDYNRSGEKQIVQKWLREFPDLQLEEELPTEKGTAVLRKGNNN